MLVQVDVDSTLYDANKLFFEVAKEFDVAWPKIYYNWFGPEDIGTDLATLKNIFKKCHSREYVSTQQPYPDASDVLAGIAEDFPSAEIAYVSDRNEQQSTALREWLEQCGFLREPEQNVVVSRDKRHWMREHKPEIVIDDRVRTLLMARYELESQCVSLEHPHNTNLKGEADGIYIVKDWKAIDRVLRSLIPEIGTVSRTTGLELVR